MTTKQIKIEELANWGTPKRVETRQGPKMLRKASPSQGFWEAWRSDKATLKEAGVSCGKDNRTGQWEACWWLPLPKEEQEQIDEALESSRAADAEIDVPSPEGLDYLPFQRAGIAYALRVFGDMATNYSKENGPSVSDRGVLIGDEMGL